MALWCFARFWVKGCSGILFLALEWLGFKRMDVSQKKTCLPAGRYSGKPGALQFTEKQTPLYQKLDTHFKWISRMEKDTTQWYASWFDTPYYHILYQDRDHSEARQFMDNLTNYLNLPEGGKILDLACGRGRHSIYLNALGFDVTGVDLSKNSIAQAKQFENDSLHFEVHDMCQPYKRHYDAVFNLFTSFGYFDHEENNLNTIKAIKENLNETGFGVIDFMNLDYVIENLVPEDVKTVNGIAFHQKRYLKDGYLIKEITFADEGQKFQFQERVKAFRLSDFEAMFENAGVYLLDVFGDYKLRKFHKTTSERLVMIFK